LRQWFYGLARERGPNTFYDSSAAVCMRHWIHLVRALIANNSYS